MRRAFLISTNNRIDRDGEIVSAQALVDYVTRVHNADGGYIGDNVLLMWHDGDPIGKIIACDLIANFLVEIAEELPDAPVNIGTADEPIETTVSQCWDTIETIQSELGVSQGFKFLEEDLIDGVYRRIHKTESSILPIEDASNPFTFVRVFDS